ncbi:MAG TPA: helix-turn-helix domain-containing protein [Actinocrinis sp.]|uniref:helix-turn-helix domain-containing protein n=1 Tax=Actinocrinis sp. TaxID=1920516 RepID=UPI002DDD346D|nr:helix-turn-helix domain-containing protein [Actinocrinis sp.]HEV3172116.1 helix-turn-helix domain-containing protein [Actinocrinis sp.]
MVERSGRKAVRDLIDQIRSDPAVLDGAVDAARGYAPLIAQLPRAQVRHHVAALINVVIAAYSETGELGEGAKAADELAFDRVVQGVPLAALLDGFQAGRVYAMSRLIDAAQDAGQTDAVLGALVELDTYSHELRNRLIDAYRSREAELARNGYSARARLLRELFHGEAVAEQQDGHQDYNAPTASSPLNPARPYHCLIADLTDPNRAAPLEALIASAGGISGFVDGYLCGVSPRLPAVDRLLHEVLVVASPPVRLTGLSGAYQACGIAMTAARTRGLLGLQTVTGLALASAADSQPQIGCLLAGSLLAKLDPADAFHRLLAETALAYLGHGKRTDTTAVALHVHPNTVKHRLRRLGELTGFDAGPGPAPQDTLGDAVRWWWALTVWCNEGSGRA